MNKQWLISGVMTVLLSAPAFAQTPLEAVTEDARRAAVDPDAVQTTEVQRTPVSVRQLSSIEFGTFASEQTGGTITVNPSGGRSATGGVSLANFTFSGPAEYEITGQPGQPVVVTLPQRVSLGRDGNGEGAEITNLMMLPREGVTLDDRGKARVRVGGTLRLPPRSTPGSYQGSFSIDARYLQ